ncbi:MAG: sodium:calcium antiporter [Nitrososphaerota archaeon]|nr:sodium:calcium antiporter [Candidatus Bathyarchaeota archaeon]MDW8022623.1 sodium:calcium antiporter [Nitrososphaerota archaeon]
MSTTFGIAAFIAGILLIYVGSKKLVLSACGLADCINLHRVVVGTILVASVTSAPEFLSSVIAALFGSSHMALGNILGSNIYNIPLIIGICGLIEEFKIENHAVGRECLLMIGLAALMGVLTASTSMVTWWIALIFLALYPVFIYYSIRKGNNGCYLSRPPRGMAKMAVFMVLGGVALTCGTFLLVYGVTAIAESFGLMHFYAGLTIMALGCVVPETAVSVAAALHGEQEISIGNVIGDNIITMTLVFGVVGLIRSFRVSLSEILLTVPFIFLMTFILFLMSRYGHKVTKAWSLAMLAIAAVAFFFETFYFAV